MASVFELIRNFFVKNKKEEPVVQVQVKVQEETVVKKPRKPRKKKTDK